MIASWTSSGRIAAEGIYPGGQSENPASPWYENLIADWWNGRYLPMPAAGRSGSVPGAIRWTLLPVTAGIMATPAGMRRHGATAGPRSTGRPAAA